MQAHEKSGGSAERQPPVGVITEVHGPVAVIACETLPPLRQALSTSIDQEVYVFEVHQHLDERHVRAISLHRSSGLYRGIAPDADLVTVRVLDEVGQGLSSDVIAGLDEILALNQQHWHVRVVNLSLGHPVYQPAAEDPLVQAVEAIWDSGVVVVCSAGNAGRDGYGTITSPGNSRKVITVGSVTTWGDSDPGNDIISTFSSRGPTLGDHIVKPDLVTPGNRLISATAARSYLESNHPDRLIKAPGARSADYYQLSGTSMAAAVVSGSLKI